MIWGFLTKSLASSRFRLLTSIAFAVLALHSNARASSLGYSGTCFEKDSGRKKVLFTYSYSEERLSSDQARAVTRYFNADGSLNLIEEGEIKNGKLLSYSIDRKGENEKGTAEVRNGRIYFAHTKDGRTKKGEADWTPQFVMNPSLGLAMQTHWQRLLAGEPLLVRMGAVEFQDTFGFKFRKHSDTLVSGSPAVEVHMRPSSFLIGIFVGTSRLIYNPSGERLLEYHGQALPHLKDGTRYRSVDVEMVLQY